MQFFFCIMLGEIVCSSLYMHVPSLICTHLNIEFSRDGDLGAKFSRSVRVKAASGVAAPSRGYHTGKPKWRQRTKNWGGEAEILRDVHMPVPRPPAQLVFSGFNSAARESTRLPSLPRASMLRHMLELEGLVDLQLAENSNTTKMCACAGDVGAPNTTRNAQKGTFNSDCDCPGRNRFFLDELVIN